MGWWNKFVHAHNVVRNAKKIILLLANEVHREFYCSFALNFNIELDAEKN